MKNFFLIACMFACTASAYAGDDDDVTVLRRMRDEAETASRREASELRVAEEEMAKAENLAKRLTEELRASEGRIDALRDLVAAAEAEVTAADAAEDALLEEASQAARDAAAIDLSGLQTESEEAEALYLSARATWLRDQTDAHKESMDAFERAYSTAKGRFEAEHRRRQDLLDKAQRARDMLPAVSERRERAEKNLAGLRSDLESAEAALGNQRREAAQAVAAEAAARVAVALAEAEAVDAEEEAVLARVALEGSPLVRDRLRQVEEALARKADTDDLVELDARVNARIDDLYTKYDGLRSELNGLHAKNAEQAQAIAQLGNSYERLSHAQACTEVRVAGLERTVACYRDCRGPYVVYFSVQRRCYYYADPRGQCWWWDAPGCCWVCR